MDLFGIILVSVLALALIGVGICELRAAAKFEAREEFEQEAINKGFARFDPKTKKFRWLTR